MATVDYVLLLFWMIIIFFCCFQCIVSHRHSELSPIVVSEDDDLELEEAVAVPLTPRSASQCVTKIVLDVDSA